MAELSLTASAAFSPGLFHQNQGLFRVPKDFQALLLGNGKIQEAPQSGLRLSPPHLKELWQPVRLLWEYNQPDRPVSMIKRPVLMDIQDALSDSVLFNFEIAEQCARRKKILQLLMSGSNIAEIEGLNFSLLSDLMRICSLATDMHLQSHVLVDDGFGLYEVGTNESKPLVLSQRKFCSYKPFLDIIGHLSDTSIFTGHSDVLVLFKNNSAEMKDLLSVAADFYLPKNSVNSSKKSMLVPHFTWLDDGDIRDNIRVSSLKFQTQATTPLNSPETIRSKSPPKKKKQKRRDRERHLYMRNYGHPIEHLISFIRGNKEDRAAIESLKKSRSEIAQFLFEFSAWITAAGTAVIFTVLYGVVCMRVPFCTAKLLNTAFGLVLIWLSLAVNNFRDTIIYICRKSTRSKLNEEEIKGKVHQSASKVFVRAAISMLVALLRLAEESSIWKLKDFVALAIMLCLYKSS